MRHLHYDHSLAKGAPSVQRISKAVEEKNSKNYRWKEEENHHDNRPQSAASSRNLRVSQLANAVAWVQICRDQERFPFPFRAHLCGVDEECELSGKYIYREATEYIDSGMFVGLFSNALSINFFCTKGGAQLQKSGQE